MTALFPDTSPEAEQVLIDLMRRASVARKLEMLGQMNAAARQLALEGLRARHRRSHPTLPEPIAVTLQVGANYVIGGSLASMIHNVVRTTLDTDIVAA